MSPGWSVSVKHKFPSQTTVIHERNTKPKQPRLRNASNDTVAKVARDLTIHGPGLENWVHQARKGAAGIPTGTGHRDSEGESNSTAEKMRELLSGLQES